MSKKMVLKEEDKAFVVIDNKMVEIKKDDCVKEKKSFTIKYFLKDGISISRDIEVDKDRFSTKKNWEDMLSTSSNVVSFYQEKKLVVIPVQSISYVEVIEK